MANSKQNIEERKKELKEQLGDLEESLDSSVHGMKEDVSNFLNPRKIIQKYPLKSLGVSFLVGFLAANNSNDKAATSGNKSPSLFELVWNEAKKDVSKRAVKIFLNYIDAKTSAYEPVENDSAAESNKDNEE